MENLVTRYFCTIKNDANANDCVAISRNNYFAASFSFQANQKEAAAKHFALAELTETVALEKLGEYRIEIFDNVKGADTNG